MPRSENQKLKLLYLREILEENTDENHPLTAAQLIDALARRGISAERKSLYDDLDTLRLFGMDVIQVRTKTTGYYLGARTFELPELKLLVDSVQSSKFITQKKTLALIGKIEHLASVYDARLLQRQVYVRNRVKSMNESVYYNVDEISGAITADRAISFKYFEYVVSRQRRFRRDGAFYTASPFALVWDDENYYMLAWDAQAERLKHYRVDKMTDISVTPEVREGKAAFAAVDMSAYTQKVFGMFTGTETSVLLRFTNHLAGAVIDRFGKDALLMPDGDAHFQVRLTVVVSPQFYGWLFGFGTEAELLSPQSVREEMAALAGSVSALYGAAPAQGGSCD